MVNVNTREPSSYGTIRVANPGTDRYWHEMRGAYAGLRLWDPDFAIARDPWIHEKMLRDPLVRQCLAERTRAIAGGPWKIEPARNPTDDDEEAARVIEQCVSEVVGMHSARANLAKFAWEGTRHAAVIGTRGIRPFGDGNPRSWWYPTALRDINKRRVTVWREGGGVVAKLRRILKNGEVSYEEDAFPSDRIITAVYDDEESRLGFGRGLADSCYWFFYLRWKLLEEGLDAARTWAQGLMIAKTDAAAVGDTTGTSENSRDELLATLRDMKSRGVVVMGTTDSVENYDGTGQASGQLYQWFEALGMAMRQLLTGAALPSGGGEGVGSLARAEVEQDTSEGVYQMDAALLDEAITAGLVRAVWSRNRENLVDLGLGDARMPLFRSEREKHEDAQSNSQIITSLLGSGLPLKRDEAYRKAGFTVPTDEDEAAGNVILAPQQPAGPGEPAEAPFAPWPASFRAAGKKPERCPDGTIAPKGGDCSEHGHAEEDQSSSDTAADVEPVRGRKSVMSPGSQLPPEVLSKLRGLGARKLPPVGATGISVSDLDSPDVDSKAMITWRDSRGVLQSEYSASFHARNAEEKWARTRMWGPRIERVRKSLYDAVDGGKHGTREHQADTVAALIASTGMRPGGEGSASRGVFGASTLLGQHLSFDGNAAVFEFVGKGGKDNKWRCEEPAVVRALRRYRKDTDDGSPLFPGVSRADVSKRLPSGLKTKDLRTIIGTETAREAMDALPSGPLPASGPAARRLIQKYAKVVSEAVSERLNNTPAIARTAYIHPRVFDEMLERLGVRKEDLENE